MSWWRTLKAVAWSFAGIRKGSEWEKDGAAIGLVPVVVVGFGSVLLLVFGLIGLVNWVTS
jgi:Protein of unknown function (DUF2970)